MKNGKYELTVVSGGEAEQIADFMGVKGIMMERMMEMDVGVGKQRRLLFLRGNAFILMSWSGNLLEDPTMEAGYGPDGAKYAMKVSDGIVAECKRTGGGSSWEMMGKLDEPERN